MLIGKGYNLITYYCIVFKRKIFIMIEIYMTIFDMPNYLWITIVAMIILTVFCALVLKKWFVSAVITFVALAVLAFLFLFMTSHFNHY